MKTNYRLVQLLLLLLLTVSTSWGQTPGSPLRIARTTVSGNPDGLGPTWIATRFTYTGPDTRALSRRVLQPPAAGAAELVTDYTYDAGGRLVRVTERDPVINNDGTVGLVRFLAYTANTVELSFARLLPNGETRPNPAGQPDTRFIYRINAEGQVTEFVVQDFIRFSGVVTERTRYTYQNGNIVKSEYINSFGFVESTFTYEYDDKVNPFYRLSYGFGDDIELYSNRNNVTRVRIDNGFVFRTEYTYNELGLPVTKKDVTQGAVVTYIYEPVATPAPTPATGPLAFQIVSYDCNSGVLQYQMTGGNGSSIFLNLPGVISQSVTANTVITYTFPADGRQGRTVTGSAVQSGQVLPISFTNGCSTVAPPPPAPSAPPAPAPPAPPVTTGLAFQIVSYDCNSGVLQYQMTGGNGSSIFLNLPGVISQSVTANTVITYTFPADGRQGRTVTGSAVQSGQVLPISFTNGCGTVSVRSARVPIGGFGPGDVVGEGPAVVAYPNPTDDVLLVTLAEPLPAQPRFVLTGMSGRTYEVGPHLSVLDERHLKLSVRHLSAGMFLLQIGAADVPGATFGQGSRPCLIRFMKQ